MPRINLNKLSTRFYAIVVLATVMMAALSQLLLSFAVTNAYDMRDLHLSDVTESAVSILSALEGRVESGEMTREEAQAEGTKRLFDLRFGEDGYFYAFDTNGINKMHGAKPELVGTDQSGMTDAKGTKIIQGLLEIATTQGKGSMVYYYTKPNSSVEEAKIGYTVFFGPWEWMVGTGSYVADIESNLANLRKVSIAVLSVSLLVMVVASTIVVRSITVPLSALVNRMLGMRDGDTETRVPHIGARGEIGDMARSIDVFREQLVERKRLQEEQVEKDAELAREREESLKQKLAMEKQEAKEADRRRADEEHQRAEREEQRTRIEAEREARRAEQAEVVSTLSSSLSAMSQGDLSARIEEAFPEDYDELRRNFNEALERISTLVRAIVEGSRTINGESDTLNNAATEMSRRTESQAASLEETAAAITELSASVDNSSKGAHAATSTVVKAREKTEVGREVVEQTIASMSEIAESSGKISKITNVIDDIAFQTNLLALNAGVEAARAGEAGRGFSVVASEVRALAQRSSEAAKEIAELITTSGQQVENGVTLVKNSGKALHEIQGMVMSLDELVAAVADASTQQSTALSEITTAVNRLDQVTQQNAAMFEETTAAVCSLQAQAGELDRNSASFRLGRESVVSISAPHGSTALGSRVPASPSASAVNEGRWDATPVGAGSELADGWSDF